jgi:amino acid transporter
LAFALNGAVALITALSFAEMSSMFPESGGAYTFAKKVLTVRAAFVVGWVLWFAYIVAGVLYALGFAEYSVLAIGQLWSAGGGEPPSWLHQRSAVLALAVLATAAYSLALVRKSEGGGQWESIGKLVVFAVLLLAGFWALGTSPDRHGLHLHRASRLRLDRHGRWRSEGA